MSQRYHQLITSLVLVLLSPQFLFGWSEGGHNVIGFLAFKRMSPEKREKFVEIIRQHPNFDKDFKIPKNVANAGDELIYLAGRACYWPDVARSYKEFNRPTWHYQLGASLTIIDKNPGSQLDIPKTPGALPEGASLESKDLYIEQALELCRNVMKSDAKPSDKAIALCWIGHLVGDYHQPCHTGSLYCKQFPSKDGDRGANSIQTVQSKNLHAVWDQLLGPRFDLSDVKRRVVEIESLPQTEDWRGRWDTPSEWRREVDSSLTVYTDEVLQWVQGDRTEPLNLSETYLKSAGSVAQYRAKKAAERLAMIWEEGL